MPPMRLAQGTFGDLSPSASLGALLVISVVHVRDVEIHKIGFVCQTEAVKAVMGLGLLILGHCFRCNLGSSTLPR